MDLIYQKFVKETFYEDGRLKTMDFCADENYNFGFDVVDAIANKTPNKKAMIWLSENFEEKVFTFQDMKEYSNRTVNYLKSLGFKKGQKALLILKRHYQFWFIILALHKLGVIVIPATYQLVEKDITYRFNKGEIDAVFSTADGEVSNEIEKALKDSPTVKTKIIVNGEKPGWENYDKEMPKFSPVYDRPTDGTEPKRDELMLMYFTSGTTSYPKIVAHKHTYSLGHLVTGRYWHNVDPNGIHFTISDTGWGKAVWGKLYGQWLCESCVFTYDFRKFEAKNILPLFKRYHITTFCAPPTMYRFFIKDNLEQYDLSSLKYATTAGEALNPEVYNRFKDYTGLSVKEGFGQTECTLLIGNLVGDTVKLGSMGRANPQYDVVLVDKNDEEVAPGDVGEIAVRIDKKEPYGVYESYYNDPEKTAAAKCNGLYHTGDTAWQDEDGYFWYVGRTDDLIKSSGYRISPFEIESVIMEIPYVLECAVIGVPDPIRGQLVKAIIVTVVGTEENEERKKEIQNYVKKHTAPYKYPRVVEFVTELPKTISGKIRRVELRNK